MIAEVIRRRGSDSFQRLAAYVLNERDGGKGDPVDWKLAEYILDHGKQTEKVASHRITNCDATDPGFAVKECLALAAQNKRSSKDKSYHLVVSFPPGERPTDAQLIDIENTLVKAAGFEGHKRISAVHQNTDNWHLHVAIVTVHPKTLRNVTPYYDHYKLQQACIELEQKHNLTPTHHTPSPELAAKGRARDKGPSGKISFAAWVMENAAEKLTAAVGIAKNWAEVHAAMAVYGVEIKPRGAGLAVVNRTNQRNAMKASDIDSSLSFKALTDRLGPYDAAQVIEGEKPIMQYAGEPRDADPRLWELYQQERERAVEARDKAVLELRVRHMEQGLELHEWYRTRWSNARNADLNRGDWISTSRLLDHEYKMDEIKLIKQKNADREKLKQDHVIPTWDGFLTRRASRGDDVAMKTLHRRIDALIRADGLLDVVVPNQPGTGRDVGVGRG